MGVTDRILDALRTTVLLNERVASVAGRIEGLSSDVRNLDRRLIRVETALELASEGRFKLPLPDRTRS